MASTWQVTQQTYEGVLSGGVLVPGVEITALLQDGTEVVVDVTQSQYQNIGTVKSIIQAAVDQHDAVAALTSSS